MNSGSIARLDRGDRFHPDPERSYTLPSRYYYDEDIYQREHEAIFYKNWLYVCPGRGGAAFHSTVRRGEWFPIGHVYAAGRRHHSSAGECPRQYFAGAEQSDESAS